MQSFINCLRAKFANMSLVLGCLAVRMLKRSPFVVQQSLPCWRIMNSWFKTFLTWINRDVSHVMNVLLPLLWLRETRNRVKYLLLENPTCSLNMLSPVCDTSWERERGRAICTHVFSCFHPSRPLGTFSTNFGHCWFGRGSLLVPPTPVRGRRARNRNKNRNTGKCMYDDTEQINNCSFDFWLSLCRPVYTSFSMKMLPTILYVLLVSFYTHECFHQTILLYFW